jgi:hypothetical protein
LSIDLNKNTDKERLLRILDAARWAPSGDNTQPWRFEILSPGHILLHGSDTRRHVVYDLEGHASQLAVGGCIESILIAARAEGLKIEVSYRSPGIIPDEHPLFDIHFSEVESVQPDPLYPFLRTRSVNRRPLGKSPLSSSEKEFIRSEINPTDKHFPPHEVLWLESESQKRAMAEIAQSSGRLRLTIPEGYAVHREVIEWNAKTSEDRIPDQALGLPNNILPLMKWIMGSWNRVHFFNRFLAGTLIPRIYLDVLPALGASAHFVLLAPSPPKTLEDYVSSGRALCRFWLSTTHEGLQFQPEMTPLIFRSYVQGKITFSIRPGATEEAGRIALSLENLIGKDHADRAVFLGRVGRGTAPSARSLRRPLSSLITEP